MRETAKYDKISEWGGDDRVSVRLPASVRTVYGRAERTPPDRTRPASRSRVVAPGRAPQQLTRAYSLFTTIYTCPCQRERVTSPLESRDSLRLGADGPRPLRTGDGRHGRGCERCRCSDRPTARPCAAQGASRRRTNHEISAPRLLFGWGGVPGSRRQFSTPSLCGISPGTGARGNAVKSGV